MIASAIAVPQLRGPTLAIRPPTSIEQLLQLVYK